MLYSLYPYISCTWKRPHKSKCCVLKIFILKCLWQYGLLPVSNDVGIASLISAQYGGAYSFYSMTAVFSASLVFMTVMTSHEKLTLTLERGITIATKICFCLISRDSSLSPQRGGTTAYLLKEVVRTTAYLLKEVVLQPTSSKRWYYCLPPQRGGTIAYLLKEVVHEK